MNALATSIVGFYALSILVSISIIIVLIFRRKKQRKKEDFEKRDN